MEVVEEVKENPEEIIGFSDSGLEGVIDFICDVTMNSKTLGSLLIPELEGFEILPFPIH
jgi:hypothetical protein